MNDNNKKYCILAGLTALVLLLMFISGKTRKKQTQNTKFPKIINSNSAQEDKPVQNTQNNQNTSNNNDKIIILYYANWCGHSKAFIPEWEKFENYAKQNMKNVTVTKILCEGENAKQKCKGVRGFPTVMLFSNNQANMYNGERTSDALIKFVNSN